MAKTETPLQIRLKCLRKPFERAVEKTGIGQNEMVRLAVDELLESYSTSEQFIAAHVRSRAKQNRAA
jgi:hypothetical protein